MKGTTLKGREVASGTFVAGLGRALFRSDAGSGRPDLVFAVGGAIAYLVWLIVGHAHHESWRDEIHCWIVGHHATGLWDLLTGVRRYDGHPFLWYWVLHLTSLIIPSTLGLHVITVMLATGAGFLWLAYSPFPRVVRLMGLASFFLVFEYTVLCRGYVLGLFLLFSFCALYDRERPRPLRLFGLLALLAATSFYGTAIATALAVFLSLEELRGRWGRFFENGRLDPATRGCLLGLLVFGAMLALVVKTTLPPKDEYFATTWRHLGFAQAKDALLRWWIPVFPVPANLSGWEIAPTGLFVHSPAVAPFMTVIAAGALGLWLLAMVAAGSWPVAVAYLLVVVEVSLFQESRNLGDVRHWGHFSVALMACLWLALAARPATVTRLRGRLRVATQVAWAALLLLQDYTGLVFLQGDLAHPFSGSREAAVFIEKAGLRDAAFVGGFDHMASAVMGILDRPFASTNNGEIGYSVVFHNRRYPGGPEETLRLVRNFLKENPARPVVLVLNWDFPLFVTPPDLRIELLTVTARAMHPEETFRIYKATPK